MWDAIPWIICIVVIGSAAFGVIMTIKEGPQGIEYIKFCGLLLVGIFVFVLASQGFAEMASNLLGYVNVHLSEKLADFIGYIIVGAWGLCLYLYIDHNK